MKGRMIGLMAVAVLAATGTSQADDKKDRDRLQGAWKAVSYEEDGRDDVIIFSKTVTFGFKGDTFSFPWGDAKITGAGKLPARHVIHAVGPVWRGGGEGERELLASCYRRAVALASTHGCRRVALPAISTGVYRYPLADAARVAIDALRAALADHPDVEEARLWLFDSAAYDAFATALD